MSRITGMTARLRTEDFERAPIAEKIEIFLSTLNLVVDEARSEEDWEAIYSQVFSGTLGGVRRSIYQETGLRLEYDDPDTTYKADTMALIDAVRPQLEEYLAGYKRANEVLGEG